MFQLYFLLLKWRSIHLWETGGIIWGVVHNFLQNWIELNKSGYMYIQNGSPYVHPKWVILTKMGQNETCHCEKRVVIVCSECQSNVPVNARWQDFPGEHYIAMKISRATFTCQCLMLQLIGVHTWAQCESAKCFWIYCKKL